MTAQTSAAVDPRLQRLLGGPELAAVRQRLRRHFERTGADAAATRLRVDTLDPVAHRALCQLTGRASRPSRSLTLDLADLDAVILGILGRVIPAEATPIGTTVH